MSLKKRGVLEVRTAFCDPLRRRETGRMDLDCEMMLIFLSKFSLFEFTIPILIISKMSDSNEKLIELNTEVKLLTEQLEMEKKESKLDFERAINAEKDFVSRGDSGKKNPLVGILSST